MTKECYFNKKNKGKYNKKYTCLKRFRDMKDKNENENNMGEIIKNDNLVKPEDIWNNDKNEINWNIKTEDNWGSNNNNEGWNQKRIMKKIKIKKNLINGLYFLFKGIMKFNGIFILN